MMPFCLYRELLVAFDDYLLCVYGAFHSFLLLLLLRFLFLLLLFVLCVFFFFLLLSFSSHFVAAFSPLVIYGSSSFQILGGGHLLVPALAFWHGAFITVPDLIQAAYNGDITAMTAALQGGADVNMTNAYGWTPLQRACAQKHDKAVKLLISHKANLEKKDSSGRTALYWAASNGADACLKALIKAGADSNAMTDKKDTPLHAAAAGNHDVAVKYLLKHGGAVMKPDKEGKMPHELSTHRDTLDVFAKYGGVEAAAARGARKQSAARPGSKKPKAGEGYTSTATTPVSRPGSKKPPLGEGFASNATALETPGAAAEAKAGPSKPRKTSRKRTVTRAKDAKAAAEERAAVAAASSSRKSVIPPNPAEWEIPMSELKFIKSIGKGGYGEVFLGRWHGTDVAIKKIILPRSPEGEDKAIQEFRGEIAIMSKMRHPNITLFMGACTEDPKSLCIVTEFVPKGNLFNMLHEPSIHLTSVQKLKMALDTAKAMNYLHSLKPPVLHRDLKTLNLLVDENMGIKVCDFGMTKTKKNHWATTQCGTTQWMAPEILRNERYDEKADVFSFGIVMWEMLTRQPPYKGLDPMTVASKVLQQGYRPEIPPDTHPQYERLVRECWESKPKKRPNFEDIVERLRTLYEAYA